MHEHEQLLGADVHRGQLGHLSHPRLLGHRLPQPLADAGRAARRSATRLRRMSRYATTISSSPMSRLATPSQTAELVTMWSSSAQGQREADEGGRVLQEHRRGRGIG